MTHYSPFKNLQIMTTLKNEIEAIKNAKMSVANKKAALVKLGIMPYEVANIIASLPKAERNVALTFGVEIECFVNRGSVRTASNVTGLNYEYQGYNHNDNHACFKFVTDSSLYGYADPIECVSPILKGKKGNDDLKKACDTLNQAGARVNSSCGLHVHVGADTLSQEAYVNVFVNYGYLETLIDGFMAPSRRNNQYAQSYRHRLFELSQAQDAVRVNGILGSRYYKVNPQSYLRHKTIEFRQHQGTTNYKKIQMWVSFCIKLVNWSKKNRLTSAVASIDDVPFLNETEKAYFKQRTSALSSANGVGE